MVDGSQAEAAVAFFEGTAEKFGERVGALIGTEVAFRVREVFPAGSEGMQGRIPGKVVAVRIEDGKGTIQAAFVFRLTDAILLAATLLLTPKEQIGGLRSADGMEQNVADAFAEVANTLYAAAAERIGARTTEGEGIRFGGIRTIDPEQEGAYSDILPPEVSAGAELSITIPGYEPGTAVFVIGGPPFPVPHGGSTTESGKPTVLYYGKDEAIAGAIAGFLNTIGVETEATADAGRAGARIESGAALLLTEFDAEWNPEDENILRKAADKGIPLVGVSARPTRQTVLEAKRAGVRAILVHPFTPEALREKTAPFLGAAAGG